MSTPDSATGAAVDEPEPPARAAPTSLGTQAARQLATTTKTEPQMQATESGSFDVVLCDLGLPDIDGCTVARRMRARPDGGRPRLIAVSGFSRGTDRALSRAAGFDAHLTEPLPLTDLLEFLEKPGEDGD
ncbi:response regulator [Streptomyces sp. NRRL B-3229]|uniref:response regulator n=1 Tax=Streptomyces sp. NRRL B-3229 TaxID=1463836 RepID=UPI0004C0F906|nr:response regulator [Streptomyces sp. NRRL B-3229]